MPVSLASFLESGSRAPSSPPMGDVGLLSASCATWLLSPSGHVGLHGQSRQAGRAGGGTW